MRRWRPSPGRRRRPRQEDGASLTSAGSAAAAQLPLLLASTRSAATETSTGELGGSASLGTQSSGFTSERTCQDELPLYAGRTRRKKRTPAPRDPRWAEAPSASGGAAAARVHRARGQPAAPPRPGTHAVTRGGEQQPRETKHRSQEAFICTETQAFPSRARRERQREAPVRNPFTPPPPPPAHG